MWIWQGWGRGPELLLPSRCPSCVPMLPPPESGLGPQADWGLVLFCAPHLSCRLPSVYRVRPIEREAGRETGREREMEGGKERGRQTEREGGREAGRENEQERERSSICCFPPQMATVADWATPKPGVRRSPTGLQGPSQLQGTRSGESSEDLNWRPMSCLHCRQQRNPLHHSYWNCSVRNLLGMEPGELQVCWGKLFRKVGPKRQSRGAYPRPHCLSWVSDAPPS